MALHLMITALADETTLQQTGSISAQQGTYLDDGACFELPSDCELMNLSNMQAAQATHDWKGFKLVVGWGVRTTDNSTVLLMDPGTGNHRLLAS
eukprot:695749-Amphidinium_carterae.1